MSDVIFNKGDEVIFKNKCEHCGETNYKEGWIVRMTRFPGGQIVADVAVSMTAPMLCKTLDEIYPHPKPTGLYKELAL